ncbi:unnamed protein product [Protopolystoma xenopodis]|uniref:Uncharacterized protein n=1 Tax=Protopolystoma xenopodis TaxID=117903 RepID=A0A3S5B922_9PLAT|nr:unnamed protein product [Protopolystoma xenopodis]
MRRAACAPRLGDICRRGKTHTACQTGGCETRCRQDCCNYALPRGMSSGSLPFCLDESVSCCGNRHAGSSRPTIQAPRLEPRQNLAELSGPGLFVCEKVWPEWHRLRECGHTFFNCIHNFTASQLSSIVRFGITTRRFPGSTTNVKESLSLSRSVKMLLLVISRRTSASEALVDCSFNLTSTGFILSPSGTRTMAGQRIISTPQML